MKRNRNLPHSYIQLSITPRGFAQWKNKLCSAHWSWHWQAQLGTLLLLLLLVPLPGSQAPSQTNFCCAFWCSCSFGPYGIWNAPAVLHPTPGGVRTVLVTRGRCFPSLLTSVSLDAAVSRWSHIPGFLPWGSLCFSKPAQPVMPYQAR